MLEWELIAQMNMSDEEVEMEECVSTVCKDCKEKTSLRFVVVVVSNINALFLIHSLVHVITCLSTIQISLYYYM